MRIEVPKGKYVLAVSGGVDSVALLNMLSNLPGVELVVAHFNHGIRTDSVQDEKLVARVASSYGFPIEIFRAKLGKNASEAAARAARYKLLHRVKEKYGAKAIITAHHQDDLIETAFINLLRGTGRRGLSAISQNPDVVRPLINTPKAEIIDYAKRHKLRWREDQTNSDTSYLRNYIRLKLIPKLSAGQREAVVANLKHLNQINPILDKEIATVSQSLLQNGQINRNKFISLPPEVANETIAYLLRQASIRQFDQKLLNRLANTIKTGRPGTKHNVIGAKYLKVDQKTVFLT